MKQSILASTKFMPLTTGSIREMHFLKNTLLKMTPAIKPSTKFVCSTKMPDLLKQFGVNNNVPITLKSKKLSAPTFNSRLPKSNELLKQVEIVNKASSQKRQMSTI